MRLSCLVAVSLSLGAMPLYAEAAEPAAAGLSQEEIAQGFVPLFDGKTLNGWQGATEGYAAEDGVLVCKTKGGGKLLTTNQYADFIFRFEFKLPPGGNNGVAIRTPLDGNPAYVGMEIQILDDSTDRFGRLKPWQFHGSIYGVVPAKRGHQKPLGQWNSEQIMCKGSRVQVTLNDAVIVDADLEKIGEQTVDGRDHPGLKRQKGYIGFLGHGSQVEFRNIRIKEL